MWLTRLALRNPVLILMLALMTIALGGVSVQRLAVDLFPPIDLPVIRVATFYTGAGPDDIEKSITQPIERAVASAPGTDRVESTSKQGVSLVSVWFAFGTNLDNAQFEVSQRVSAILNTLPPGIQQPFVTKFDITNIPVAVVVVSARGWMSGSSTILRTTRSSRSWSASRESRARPSAVGRRARSK
jgi:multidrug efflux pump subunit AcrB